MRCPRRDKNVYYNRKRIASEDTSSVICFANATFPSKGNVINLAVRSPKAFPLEGKVARAAGRKRCPRWAQFVYYDRGTRHRGTPLQSASQTASPQGEAFWARRQVFFP